MLPLQFLPLFSHSGSVWSGAWLWPPWLSMVLTVTPALYLWDVDRSGHSTSLCGAVEASPSFSVCFPELWVLGSTLLCWLILHRCPRRLHSSESIHPPHKNSCTPASTASSLSPSLSLSLSLFRAILEGLFCWQLTLHACHLCYQRPVWPEVLQIVALKEEGFFQSEGKVK